jgi:cytochrome c556
MMGGRTAGFWQRFTFVFVGLMLGACVARGIAAEEKEAPKLPPGPIRDRHELMEGVGKNAKKIGESLKAGKPAEAAKPAEDIAAVMYKFTMLFPPGSTDPNSRAKPEIWEQKAKFNQDANDLKEKALAFAKAASSGGDVKETSKAMWASCKACHDSFRVPKPGE